MSVNNFIPQMWTAMIIEQFRKSLVAQMLFNRNYEGEISAVGDSVRINGIGDPAVASYTKNSTSISPETLNDQSQVLQITQSDYFCFEVDDVDKRQAKGDLLAAGMSRAAYKMRDTADAWLLGLYGQAGVTTDDIDVNSINAYEVVLTARQALNELSAPTQGRVMIVPPWFVTKLLLRKVLSENTSNQAFDNGFVGRCGGFDIHESNNLTNDGTYDKMLAGTNEAGTMADQMNEVEAFRPESAFSDAVKGLHLYGAKIVQPDALVCISAQEVAEP